jgi:hypothetical protein
MIDFGMVGHPWQIRGNCGTATAILLQCESNTNEDGNLGDNRENIGFSLANTMIFGVGEWQTRRTQKPDPVRI